MLYLILAVAASAAMAIVLKCFRNQKGNRYGILLGNYLTCVVISFFMLPDRHLIGTGSWITLVCGIGGGIFFVLALICMQSSIRSNGAGLTSAFARLGLIIALGVRWGSGWRWPPLSCCGQTARRRSGAAAALYCCF